MLTEIYLCHACSDHEVEDGHGPGRLTEGLQAARARSRASGVEGGPADSQRTDGGGAGDGGGEDEIAVDFTNRDAPTVCTHYDWADPGDAAAQSMESSEMALMELSRALAELEDAYKVGARHHRVSAPRALSRQASPSSLFRDRSRSDIGKSQSKGPQHRKMETPMGAGGGMGAGADCVGGGAGWHAGCGRGGPGGS
eukprot:COSAG01_NODE_2139_length_8323_cov_13.355788_5_plen_197_part_00